MFGTLQSLLYTAVWLLDKEKQLQIYNKKILIQSVFMNFIPTYSIEEVLQEYIEAL